MNPKKYLYVSRPLLARCWIERQLAKMPKCSLQLVCAALAEFVARKQVGQELAVVPPFEVLCSFVEAELPRLKDAERTELRRRRS